MAAPPGGRDRADRLVFFEHRHGDVRPCATEPSRRIQSVLGCKIRDMDCLFCVDSVPEAASRTRLKSAAPLIVFDKCCWHAEMRHRANATALAQEHLAKFGLADRDGMLQHRLEYWLQLTRRAADYAQHLGGCCLLFECLGENRLPRRRGHGHEWSDARTPRGRSPGHG
jgi:hypothetical protein